MEASKEMKIRYHMAKVAELINGLPNGKALSASNHLDKISLILKRDRKTN